MDDKNIKLAVLIGSQPRSLDISAPFIHFLLDELIGIPYDIYICCDKKESDDFKGLKNIKDIVFFEDQINSTDPEKIKLWKTIMTSSFYQWAKLYFAKEASIKSKEKYDFGLKLRTDFVIGNRPRMHFSKWYKSEPPSLETFKSEARESFLSCGSRANSMLNGDKFMFSRYHDLVKWANLAADCEKLSKKMDHYVPLKWKDNYSSCQTFTITRYNFPKKFVNGCKKENFLNHLQEGIDELRTVYTDELPPEETQTIEKPMCFTGTDTVADLQLHEVTNRKHMAGKFPFLFFLIFSDMRREKHPLMANNGEQVKYLRKYFKI